MGDIEKPKVKSDKSDKNDPVCPDLKPKKKPGPPKGTRPSGRTKGTPNKITADIKAIAQEYGPRAIDVLATLMQDGETPASARIAAARELLLRGYGQPTLSLDVDIKTSIYKLTDAELLDIAARGRSLPQQDCIDITPAQVSLPGLDDDTDDG